MSKPPRKPVEPVGAGPGSPYLGLKSFSDSDDDAALFFGRERERELIVANLLASRLTLLYGQSGIGKSSLLCAGVVNYLRRPVEDADGVAPPVVVYVSDWQGAADSTVLAKIGDEAARLTGSRRAPPDPELPFDRVLGWWTEQLGAQLLLIFDQFEQYFLHHPPDGKRSFERGFAGALLDPALRVHCLISLREDSLVGLDRFKGELPNLFRNRLRLDGLSKAAALEAICGPVDRYNEQRAADRAAISLEPCLATTVVSELQEAVVTLARRRGPSSAPSGAPATGAPRPIEPAHLQLVMEALWERESELGSSSLRIGTLAALGGCEEIVGSHVEASLAGLPAKQRSIAARSIRYLVTPSGIKVAHTPGDLADYVDAPTPLVAGMLESLCGLRLMRPLPPQEGTSERRYEVFHDLLAAPMLEWRAGFEARRLQVRMGWLLAALVAALATAIAIAAYSTSPTPLRSLELSSIDARFGIRGTVPPDRDIVIVYVDNRTLNALHIPAGNEALRPHYAKLIELLLRGKPDVIADDLEFLTPGKEGALLRAIAHAHGRIVLASNEFDRAGNIPLFGETEVQGIKQLSAELGHPKPGYSGLPLDPDGVVRSVRFMARPGTSEESDNLLGALSVEVAKLVAPHLSLPTSGSMLIDYHGPPGTFTSVSMLDVLRGSVRPAFFKNKIVLIGVSVPGGEDLHRVPFTSGATMPGTEVQANAISSVRHGQALRGAGGWVTDLVIAALSLTALLAVLAGSWLALALYAAVATIYLLIVQLLFDAGIYLPLVYPLLALALAALGTIVARLYLHRLVRSQRARSV